MRAEERLMRSSTAHPKINHALRAAKSQGGREKKKRCSRKYNNRYNNQTIFRFGYSSIYISGSVSFPPLAVALSLALRSAYCSVELLDIVICLRSPLLSPRRQKRMRKIDVDFFPFHFDLFIFGYAFVSHNFQLPPNRRLLFYYSKLFLIVGGWQLRLRDVVARTLNAPCAAASRPIVMEFKRRSHSAEPNGCAVAVLIIIHVIEL